MEHLADWRDLLRAIDPAQLDYTEWVKVGMAVHAAGGAFEDWDNWSRNDAAQYAKNRPDAMRRKWQGFHGAGVTEGTLYHHATQQGWKPERNADAGRAYSLDEIIHPGKHRNRAADWAPEIPTAQPGAEWNQAADLIKYLDALFQPSDYVGYVLDSIEKEGKHTPGSAGVYTVTAGEILAGLRKNGKIQTAVGTVSDVAGAWIRFNPLDGKGVRDSNVTAHRFALVESDTETIERQRGIYEELQLPIAALVDSGNKSLHAIVRIDAENLAEYKERVEYLYRVCKKEGLQIDSQNKNAARLSRMPGVMRSGRKQYLVATNMGKASWADWRAWREELDDHLPDIESLASVWDNMPPLAAPLIDGILRRGHKMLLSGPSKAGKSFLLLQLAIAIAEGRDWLGWPITGAGKVLYINLELDRPSCLRRIQDVYAAREWEPARLGNLDVWHLRGQAVPLDELAPKLIRRAIKQQYAAVIIDPIYKVLTGDESAADDMARFCNQFDRICHQLGSAVIYCHHHSKGEQGHKRSRDRSSGSGVFARDPDAILDMLELIIDEPRRGAITNQFRCDALEAVMGEIGDGWRDEMPEDDMKSSDKFAALARQFAPHKANTINDALRRANTAGDMATGWRIETTLREFAPRRPDHVFFVYPLHHQDRMDLLLDAPADGELVKKPGGKTADTKPKDIKQGDVWQAYLSRISMGEKAITVENLACDLKVSPSAITAKMNNILTRMADGTLIDKESAYKRAQHMAGIGKTITEIAAFFGLSEKTISEKYLAKGRK